MDDRKKSLLLNYDDSSDEEDIDEQNGLSEALPLFRTKITNDTVLVSQIDDLAASFSIYYYGLLVYHAPVVNLSYQKSKSELLANNVVPSDDIFKDWIANAIRVAIETELDILDHPRASKKIIKLCLNSVASEIGNFIDICMANLRIVMRASFYGKRLPLEVEESFNTLSLAIFKFISVNNNFSSLNASDFKPPHYVTPENLFQIPGIREYLETVYKKKLGEIANVHRWVTENAFKEVESLLSPQKKISSAGSIKGRCDEILDVFTLSSVQVSYIMKIKELNYAVDPHAFTNNFKKIFLEKKLRKLIDKEKVKANSILQEDKIIQDADLSDSEFSEFSEHMEDFIPCNGRKFREILTYQHKISGILGKFLSILMKTSQDLEKDISRQTLPTVCIHNIHDCVEYIVSLRLTNRSIIRTYRNQGQVSILGDNKEEHHDFGWKFPASDTYIAIERNRITNNARSALIPIQTTSNAYDDVVAKIKIVKKNPAITDQAIGMWVRRVLQNKTLTFNFALPIRHREDLIMFIIQLAHLLGGTECMRYPGAIIANQMALDLIIAGQLEWSEALDSTKKENTYLPMTMIKATNVCRALMTTYGQFTNHQYHYPGDPVPIVSQPFKAFIRAEKKLSDKWYKFFKVSLYTPKEKQLSDAIKKEIPRWYPGIVIK